MKMEQEQMINKLFCFVHRKVSLEEKVSYLKIKTNPIMHL